MLLASAQCRSAAMATTKLERFVGTCPWVDLTCTFAAWRRANMSASRKLFGDTCAAMSSATVWGTSSRTASSRKSSERDRFLPGASHLSTAAPNSCNELHLPSIMYAWSLASWASTDDVPTLRWKTRQKSKPQPVPAMRPLSKILGPVHSIRTSSTAIDRASTSTPGVLIVASTSSFMSQLRLGPPQCDSELRVGAAQRGHLSAGPIPKSCQVLVKSLDTGEILLSDRSPNNAPGVSGMSCIGAGTNPRSGPTAHLAGSRQRSGPALRS